MPGVRQQRVCAAGRVLLLHFLPNPISGSNEFVQRHTDYIEWDFNDHKEKINDCDGRNYYKVRGRFNRKKIYDNKGLSGDENFNFRYLKLNERKT